MHYLDGFLAATRPEVDRAGAQSLRPSIQPDCALRSTSPVPPSEPEESSQDKIKRRLHPLDSFSHLLECVEANCPPTLDDRFRFQWFGLLYQAPHQDAFLLRLRLPGGRVQAFQLSGLAEITQRYAAGQILLNVQGGLDIPGVPLSMATEILYAVEEIGLSARQTSGDCVQSVRIDEPDGWADAKNGLILPLVLRLEQALAHSRRLADLPRGCEIVFLAADQPLASRWSESADAILLKRIAPDHLAASNDLGPGCEACFLLVVSGEATGGWRLTAAQVVPGCLKLLEDWATNADRTLLTAAPCRTSRLASCSARPRGSRYRLCPRLAPLRRVLPRRMVSLFPTGVC